ncbi:MAG: hypothetical protein CMQ40_10700 [Gammaproteobacteria bacterium]|nr:hypothetical protein [Gammaproteobacteria bacterium]
MLETDPCDLKIQLKSKRLLETVPMLAEQEDTYELVTLNSGQERNIEDRWKGTIVFVTDTLSELIEGEDQGGFFDAPQFVEDYQRRDLRLQFEFYKKKAEQAEASRLIAQIREFVLTKRAWMVERIEPETGVEVSIDYLQEVAVFSVPPKEKTSDDYLYVAISVVFGYSFLGGDPRNFAS